MKQLFFSFLRVCAQWRGTIYLLALSIALVAPGCSFKAHVKTSGSTSGKSSASKSKSATASKKDSKSNSSASRGSRASVKVSGKKKFKASFKSGSKKVFTSKKRAKGIGSSGKIKDSFSASFKLRKRASAQAKLRLKMKKRAKAKAQGSVNATSKRKTNKPKGSTRKLGTKKARRKNIAPKSSAPKSSVPKNTEPKSKPPQKSTPQKAGPKKGAPKSSAPKQEPVIVPTKPIQPPVEEPPVEEPPAEEPPVEEPPVEEPPVEEPPAPIEPPEEPPENVFGYAEPVHGCFEGIVYPIDPNSKRLPTDYESLDAVSALYACEWDIPVRDWAQGFPELEDYYEWFAIRYTGTFKVAVAGEWTFRLASDDGSKLLIDGAVVVDNDGVHAPRQKKAKVQLEAGDHELVLEYFQGPRYHINLQLYATPPDGQEGVFSVR